MTKNRSGVDRYAFTQTLMILLRGSSVEFCNLVKDKLDSYLAGWRLAGSPRNVLHSASRANIINRHADDLLAIEKSTNPHTQDIQCRKGCAHCCKMRVAITSAEADLLLMQAVRQNLVVSGDTLKKQAQWKSDREWARQPQAERTCVFLGADGDCQVYEHRPLSCRKYFVLSPPESCRIDSETRKAKEVLVWFDAESEVLSSAAMTHFGVESLPVMLLQAKDRLLREIDSTRMAESTTEGKA